MRKVKDINTHILLKLQAGVCSHTSADSHFWSGSNLPKIKDFRETRQRGCRKSVCPICRLVAWARYPRNLKWRHINVPGPVIVKWLLCVWGKDMLAPWPHHLPVNTMDGGRCWVLNAVLAGCLDLSASTESSEQSRHQATDGVVLLRTWTWTVSCVLWALACSVPLARDPIYPVLTLKTPLNLSWGHSSIFGFVLVKGPLWYWIYRWLDLFPSAESEAVRPRRISGFGSLTSLLLDL